jgi:hypothetical protein
MGEVITTKLTHRRLKTMNNPHVTEQLKAPSPVACSGLLDAPGCDGNRYHPSKPRCEKRAAFIGTGTGNFTDSFVWCEDHAMDMRPEYLKRI